MRSLHRECMLALVAATVAACNSQTSLRADSGTRSDATVTDAFIPQPDLSSTPDVSTIASDGTSDLPRNSDGSDATPPDLAATTDLAADRAGAAEDQAGARDATDAIRVDVLDSAKSDGSSDGSNIEAGKVDVASGGDAPVGLDMGSVDLGGVPGECVAGDVYVRACGMCGTASRTCTGNAWGPWDACIGQGECSAGSIGTQTCGTSVGACKAGTQARTCSATCHWGDWGACGDTYVGPSPEVCGDGIDNNCNGATDEGCACKPVAAGAAASFAVSGSIVKLVPDPSACFVYGLNSATQSQVVVFDTAQKKELVRVDLGGAATDLDISPDGSRLVASLDSLHRIAIIDKGLWTSTTVSTAADPQQVEVTNGGIAYYVTQDQWSSLHRIDLAVGLAGDTTLGGPSVYEPDIELGPGGDLLFMGESGLSGSNLYNVNVAAAKPATVDHSTWDDNYGFPYATRHLYLGPSGKHIYYAGYQLDATNLALVLGQTGIVFAEDAAASFAVSENGILDAQLMSAVATFPAKIGAAALASADTELWYYTSTTGKITYANVNDFIAGKTLGAREGDAGPIGNYTFAKVVADPVRSRLYGLDVTKNVVISIDADTGMSLRSIILGSGPSDIAIDPAGTFIYVGHTGTLAIAQIDAATFSFAKFIPTPRDNYDIAALAAGRVATIDYDQWTSPTIIDVNTGAVLAYADWGAYAGALSATSDGNTLFVGESGISGGSIIRYDVSGGKLQSVAKSTYDSGYGFSYPARSVVATPDGTSVYYAGYCLNGTNLVELRYPQTDTILSITPNSALAISATKIYRVSDGTALATLSGSCRAQAISPDSATLYCVSASGITKNDLTVYQ